MRNTMQNTTQNTPATNTTAHLSRRQFISGCTATAAAAMATRPIADVHADETTAHWDLAADVVIVGSGAAGCAAAVTAIEEGATVIMLEKSPTLGGISSSCVQFCAHSSSLHAPQAYPDVEDSADAMFEANMASSRGTADPEFLRILCDESPSVIDWMVEHGCQFKETLRPSDGRAGQGKYITATPGELISHLMPLIQENAQVLTETPVISIIREDEDGRVIGVACQIEGGDLYVGATKAVIVCSGPWPDDEILEAHHMPPVPNMVAECAQTMASLGLPYGPYTGEAIRACMKIGATTRHMEYIMPDPYYSIPELMTQGVAAFGISRSVNQVLISPEGTRFTDEGKVRGAIADDIISLPGNVYYPVTDGHIVPNQLQMGGSREKIESWVEQGLVARGETLEELAASMEQVFDIPADAALHTLKRYNKFCLNGCDEDFGKDPHYLVPYDQPPFYAGPAETCRFLYTHGGLATDTGSHVLDIDGATIPGLYAAGMCTGGHLGRDTISGNWQVDCVVFGRIAGANAAKEA